MRCPECLLPDPYNGQGDGIGSCDCPRCERCGGPDPAGDGPGWVDRRAWLEKHRKRADAAGAELAEVTAQLETAYRAMVEAQMQRDTARADREELSSQARGLCDRLAEVTAERSELQQLFELQWRRTQEATKLWRAEAPAERELIQPDLGALLRWLMDRADTARRDGAADALEHAASELAGPPSDVELSVLRLLNQWAAEVRSGEREIPTRQDGDAS